MFSEGNGGALGKMLGTSETSVPVPVTLPHDAVITTERRDFQQGSCTGYYEGKNVNYTKTFFIPDDCCDKVIWIEFEGIYQNGFIYVNGSYAGKCTYGYGNYYIDITRFVKVGENNKMSVVVINGMPSGRWYTGGGIYRNVNLMIGNPLHIKCEGTRISASDIEASTAIVTAVTPIEYVGYKPVRVQVRNEIFDESGKLVASAQGPVTFAESGIKEFRQTITVQNPHLWDTDNPFLYTCNTILMINEQIIDSCEDTFGIRKLQLDPIHGLRINGKTVKLRGGCIHHDNGIIGSAAFAHADERRIRKLKEAGYNAIRCAHNPAGKSLLDACDKLGMLVMDEFTDVWTTTKVDFDYGFHFAQNWEQDVANMIYKDFNHPCVIMYSIGNEIPENGDEFDVLWGEKIVSKIRSLDSTRYTVNCINMIVALMGHMDKLLDEAGLLEECSGEVNTMMAKLGANMEAVLDNPTAVSMLEETCAQVDVAGYNYAAFRYEPDSELFPNRIFVGSETMPPTLDENWRLVENNPCVIGDFSWTAWDYLGEVGCGKVSYSNDPSDEFYSKWPWRTAYCGDFNLSGDRRTISYWREIIWKLRTKPYISVRPPKYYGQTPKASLWSWISDSICCWNWSGYEGKPVTVEVLSGTAEVELFLNGKSLGKKRTGDEKACCAIFDLAYEPGELRAVADGGEEFVLRSAEDESCISLCSDKSSLCAGEQDIAFVEISICDQNGVLNAGSNKKIQVSVEGAGSLCGLGSATPNGAGDYYDEEWDVYEGRALAVVRSGKEKGLIKVTVRASGCQSESIDIVVE